MPSFAVTSGFSWLSIAILIVQTVFDFYILILMLRFLLKWAGINFFNPISQFFINFTNPLVKPLQKYIPNYKGVSLAILLLMFIIQILELIIIVELRFGQFPHLGGLLILAVGQLLVQLANIYFYALVIRALLSWLSPTSSNPVYQITVILTQPFLRWLQKIIPPIGGFDFTPVVAAIIIKFIEISLIVPLVIVGQALTLGP